MTISELMAATAVGSALALAASAHCAVMCGPISVVARARGGRRGSVLYLTGRTISYTLAGSLAGSVGHLLLALPQGRWLSAALSWLLGASLLYAALRGARGPARADLVQLGRRPRANLFGRLLSLISDEPLLLGALTALLPCGMLFGALVAAGALGTALQGAVAMAVFALLSGVALAGVAELSRSITIGRHGRRLLDVALVVCAVVLFVRPLTMVAQAGPPACHSGTHSPTGEP